jgi:hypothetical protein
VEASINFQASLRSGAQPHSKLPSKAKAAVKLKNAVENFRPAAAQGGQASL